MTGQTNANLFGYTEIEEGKNITIESYPEDNKVKISAGLSNNDVTTDKIANKAVTGAKIADGTIGKGNLNSSLQKQLDDAVNPELEAGANITITESGKTLTISSEIEAGSITPDMLSQEVKDELDSKQEALVAGENITIENNVISANVIDDYNDLLNQPIKNLELVGGVYTNIKDIPDGCYTVKTPGGLVTNGGYEVTVSVGDELCVKTSESGIKQISIQSPTELVIIDSNTSSGDGANKALTLNDTSKEIVDSVGDTKVPTDKAVKDYVDSNIITNYNDLLNQPIKNLDLGPYAINNPIQLSAIGEGIFIVTSNGHVATQGGYKKLFGKGTELVIVRTNKNHVPTLCMSVQDGINFYRIDDDFSTGSDLIRWLSSNNKTTIIDNDNASKIPTSGAVMNYVTEIVNNSIADVLGGAS